jgi:hypothetical protein
MSVKHHYAARPSKKWCPECDTTQPTGEFGEAGRNKVCKRCNARRRPSWLCAVTSPSCCDGRLRAGRTRSA